MEQDMSSSTEIRFIKLPQVLALCGRSKSSIYGAIKKGEFPAPVKLSCRSVGWIYSEIASWAEERVKASRSGGRGLASSASESLLSRRSGQPNPSSPH